MAFRQIKSPALGDSSVLNTKLDASAVSGQASTTALADLDTLLVHDSGSSALKSITAAYLIGSFDTSDLTEDAGALYFTPARAQSAVAADISSAVAAEAVIARAAESQNATDIAAEEARALAAEGVLTTNLATEVSDRAAADTALDTAYKAADAGLQTQISNIISNTDATALNSLAEIVAEFQSADSTLTAAVSANGTAISNEVTRASTAEGVNATAIATETTRAQTAEGVNTAAIVSEAATARAAENALDVRVTANEGDISTLQSGLAAEITATNADISTLTTNLNAEITRAGLAEAANATDINTEATARAAADTALDVRVTANESDIAFIQSNTDSAALDSLTEIVSAFQNADNTLTGAVAANTTQVALNVTAIAAEETRALAAEAANTLNITANTGDIATNTTDIATNTAAIATEVTNRTTADTTLQANITAEATTARAAELQNANDIAAEETRALAAESANATAISNEVTRATAKDNAHDVLLASHTTDIAANTTAINTEAASRAAADATLTADVATNTTAIANILSNTDATALNSLAEIVTEFQSVDATLTSLSTAATTDRALIRTEFAAADTLLSNRLTTEEGNVDTLEATMGSAVLTTTAQTVTEAINELNSGSAAAVSALQTEVDAMETAIGLNANGTFTAHSGTNYMDSGSTMKAVDVLLDAAVKANEDAIAAEAVTARAAEGTNATNIATNVTNIATNATNIAANVTAIAQNATDITAEATTARAAESANASAITAEATTARAAELANANAITAEATTARAAESANAAATAANLVEITATQSGAGLDATGAYVAPTTSNYHDAASSLADADMKLDAAIKAVDTAYLAADATLTANVATNTGAISALDTRVTANETDIAFIQSNTDAAALDSLTEIVNAFQAADGTLTGAVAANTTQVATNVTDIATNVTAIAARLPLAGGTMSGDVDMDSNMVTNLGTASAAGDAVSLSVMQAAITAQDISVYDTDDLAEGSNEYFTPARARAAISVTDTAGNGLASYDSSTGVISIDTNESVLDLTDVSDSSYTGKAEYVLQVKADESGMELADPLQIFTANNRQTIPGDGSATTYSLNFSTDQANSMVFVGGVIQDPVTHYTINSSAQTITFASALPTGTAAVVVAHAQGLTPTLTAGQVTTDNLSSDIKAYVQGSDVAATGSTTIDTFSGVLYRSAKYIMQVDDGAGNYETREALVVHDGTTAYITEYAMVYTGSDLIGDASVTMSGNNVLLQYTPTSGSATVKVIATYMDV